MSGLTRRRFLATAAGATAAGALSSCASPVLTSLTGGQPQTADVIFWHLFGGGDGANMTTMIKSYQRRTSQSVEATLLPWGNPYYTKLALAASSGRPPDVAVTHLSRLPLLARAGLLEPLAGPAESVGITESRFTPAAWTKATVDGAVYAIPLDTHPFVMYYNARLAEKAGLLDRSGKGLTAMSGRDHFVDALKQMKRAGGSYGAISANTTDPSTTWRWFMTVYSGLAGSLVGDGGTKVTADRDAMGDTFAFLQSLTGDLGLMPGNATPTTVSTLFGQGRVGFLFDGEWQIPTYRGLKLPGGKPLDFNVEPFPALLGREPASYADSHALVIPRSSGRSDARFEDALRFIRGLLDESATWADGGHIPAWLPVQKSRSFEKLKPQSNYRQAAFDAVYDPPGWYTGAGSDFQNAMGAVITEVLAGRTSPSQGVTNMTASLRSFSRTRPPVTTKRAAS